MKHFQTIIFTAVIAAVNIFAATEVKVYSRDEGLTETNISKPRIYIENTGTTTLTDFVYYYKFTIEGGKTPVLEDYYTPQSSVSLEQISTEEFRLKYEVTGASFVPGQLLPESSGNIVGLHYNDWSTWNKVNDYSNNQSSTFAENNKISVYVDGVLIYGEEIEGVAVAGSITREVWSGIYGTLVSAIPTTTQFSSTGTLTSFEEPQNWSDYYGTRLRGYITAPASGTYYFYIAGDDCCELRLSSDDRQENKSVIAYVSGYTDYRTWDKYTSQKSAAITLTAGERYYVEALHKEGSQNDNLSVGWLMPGETEIEVITGSVLTPFVSPDATPSLTAVHGSPTQINLSWSENCTNEDGYQVQMAVSGGSYSQIADLGPNYASYQSTGLTSGTTYSYRVRAYNSQGYSAWSNVFTLTTQESTNGVIVREVWENITGTETSLIPTTTTPSWTKTNDSLNAPRNVCDNRGTRIRGYIMAPLTGSYTFWISGDDDCDFYLSTNTSPSNKVKICYVDGYTDTMTWNKYSSQKSDAKILTAGQKYYFEILHKEGTQNDNMEAGWLKPGESGIKPSEVIHGSVLYKFVAPAAPSNFTAVAVSGSQINLTWSDNSDNEENFIIEQSTDGTTYTQVASLSPGITSSSITGLLPSTTYSFRVKAVNSAGSSAWSSVASATTQITNAGAISRQMWINVTDGSGVGDIPVTTTPYLENSLPMLQDEPNAGDEFGTRVLGYLTAPTTGSYTFWVSGDNDCELRLSTSEDPADKVTIAYFTGWTDSAEWDLYATQKSSSVDLVAGKRYYIEVLHVEGTGDDHMAVGWAKPGESTTEPSEIVPGTVLSMYNAPVAPSGLAVTVVSSTQLDLSWNDNSDNETGFLIERALAGETNFTQIGTAGAGATSFASTGLTANTEYQFRVRATNYVDNSDYSNIATGITAATGDQGGPELFPQLLTFAIYSEELSYIGQRSVFSGGGAVGSNTLVNVDIEAKIVGDIVCGGNVELLDRVEVQGDITCAGTVSTVETEPPTISGTVTENASVTDVDIPVEATIKYGTTDVSVAIEHSDALSPGSYKDLTIGREGTLTLTQGVYNFRSVTIENDASMLFDVPMDKKIEINVETSLEFKDRAAAKFVESGYAPCIKMYTNAYSINIGDDVTFSGILTAPNAALTICSRTQIEGAAYAKNITLQPDAIIISSIVDPNGNNDSDCVLNLTEMMLRDEPDNPYAYSLIAVPNPAMIDNTQDQMVTYDFGCSYHYFTCRWDLTYPAGTLTNASVAPAYIFDNKPPGSIPEFSETGYKPIGNYVHMVVNTLNDSQSIRVALPLFAGIQPMISYSIAWYNTDEAKWVVTDASPITTCAIISDGLISDVSSMIIVENESNVVAYLDDGMVYSNVAKATLRFNGLIDAKAADDPTVAAGSVTINYLEHTTANPSGIAGTPLVWDLTKDGSGLLYIDMQQDFTDKITVTSIQITSGFFSTYTYSENFVVNPGQMLSFVMDRTAEEMDNTKINGEKILALYDANALSFESMSFSEGVITGTESAWNYDYYLKDHLGSTRMVLNENGDVKQALMYQPYGTVSDVVEMGATSTDPLREKFTTKEFDEEGDANGAPGIGAYHFGFRVYDPDIGVWMSTDPDDQYWNTYSYCGGDPVNYYDPNGQYAWVGFAMGAAIGGTAGLIGGYAATGDWGKAFLISLGTSAIGAGIGYGLGSMKDAAMAADLVGPTPTEEQALSDLGWPSEGYMGGNTAAQDAAQISLGSAVQPDLPTVTPRGDDESLIYFWRTVNQRGSIGKPPRYYTPPPLQLKMPNPNILMKTPFGDIIKAPNTNPNVWRSDEQYNTGSELLNKDIEQVQRGILKVGSFSPLSSPDLFWMVRNGISNWFLNKMAGDEIYNIMKKNAEKTKK